MKKLKTKYKNSAPITIQYFKVTITSGYDDNSGEDVFFTHLAEVGIY